MAHEIRQKLIVVIGAGAAGLMAAAAASESGARVTVLEKNEKAGKKIYITGKGRCNLTNACDTADFFEHVVRNPKFLYSAVYGFDSSAVMAFMEENGCRVKTERGDRVFPVSDHASDVTKALLTHLGKNGASIRYNTRVREICVEDGAVTGVRTENGMIAADAVILCTGGKSYPSTGSTGDGYRWAALMGLNVKKPAPSLAPFTVKEDWCAQLQGISLKNVQLTLHAPASPDGAQKSRRRKDILYTGFGEMLFTHFGISGPLVLTASCYADFDKQSEYLLTLDLKPYMTTEELTDRIRRELAKAKGKELQNALRSLFPMKLAKTVADISGLGGTIGSGRSTGPGGSTGSGGTRVVSGITDKEIEGLAAFIKNIPIHATGTRGFNEAIVTKGGIDVRAFDPSTMECRTIRGLYAAGEVLDVDAHTGGFNLQIAWSTGHLAGVSAALGGSQSAAD